MPREGRVLGHLPVCVDLGDPTAMHGFRCQHGETGVTMLRAVPRDETTAMRPGRLIRLEPVREVQVVLEDPELALRERDAV